MKTTIMLFLIIFVFLGCDAHDKFQPRSKELKTSALIPKMDLHAAVVTNNLKLIRQHIKAGSDLNVLEPSRSSTPLITAAALGKTEAAKILIDARADLNYQNTDGSTALHTAVVFDNTEIAKDLIDAGINLNIKNNNGSTALHAAAFFGRVEIVETLLAKGADKTLLNKTGQTAFETIQAPFNDVKPIYDAIGAGLKPLGLVLDYDRLKTARPQIAEILK